MKPMRKKIPLKIPDGDRIYMEKDVIGMLMFVRQEWLKMVSIDDQDKVLKITYQAWKKYQKR
jgi:hypothetical protein